MTSPSDRQHEACELPHIESHGDTGTESVPLVGVLTPGGTGGR